MKKLLLFASSSLIVFLGLGVWSTFNMRDAHFTLNEGIVNIESEVNPFYANIALASEDLEPLKPTVETLLTTGLSITLEGNTYFFPAQMKDLIVNDDAELPTLKLTSEFLNYITSTLNTAVYVPATDIRILEADETKTSKVSMEGIISNGKELDTAATEAAIALALSQNSTSAEALAKPIQGRIVNETGKDLGPLTYLAEGRSSFWGSSPEREFNIRKAMNERFNGILIPPGAEFSYVEFLGPIEYAGWKQAYTIFQGTKLEKAPAGGVCQISTTVYRAALDAALTISEQRSHSLYVIYYQHFGDGLDATVFPGEQDFKFVNNTPNYLLMVVQEEGYKEAVIRFFGEDDGRHTELYGPYTASNQTEEMKAGVGSWLGIGQIAWKQVTTWGDGTVEEKWLLSDYMSPAQQHREAVELPLQSQYTRLN